MKKIVVACDHAGLDLKNAVAEHLMMRGCFVTDVGTDTTDSCHYPDYAHAACQKVQSGECDAAMLICGTGIGMCIAANKHSGIRAACCSDTFSARLTRRHNDANVLCLGARVVGLGLALDVVDAFLDNSFEGGKHQTRIDKIASIEQ